MHRLPDRDRGDRAGGSGLSEAPAYARIAVARPFTEVLTYAVPAHLGEVGLGHAVEVPLGKRGTETGYVVGRTAEPGFDPAKIKPIARLLDPVPAFGADQLGFFEWIADYYLVPLGLVIQTALPAQMQARTLSVLVPTEAGVEALTARAIGGQPGQVLREIVSRPELTRRGLARRLQDELEATEVARAVAALERQGLVALADKEIGGRHGMIRTVSLSVRGSALSPAAAEADPAGDSGAVGRLGPRMASVLESLAHAGGSLDLAALLAEQGASARESVARLAERGLVQLGERENRDPLLTAADPGSVEAPPLNGDQRAALDAITGASEARTFLLFGVTGSGKTEVFLGAAKALLARDRQVLVLVPEIGLTPQLVGRFRARFGSEVAVLHSGLSGAERLAQWRRIRAGEARVAVGARSALFAPFRRLGLVVVDEEHDDSYKQDERVPYNARDLSVVLGRRHGCAVVLASATPSLESWHNAVGGRYTLLRLPERATPRPVPAVEVVDMTSLQVEKGAPTPLLAPEVESALRATFERGGQAIVLYNRRGFATMVQCTSCGGTYECPNCGITMTLHRRAKVVACHYCGLKRPYGSVCPICDSPTLEELGKGTERIEEALAALFPGVAMDRMDADTTAGPGAHQRILGAFREGRTQLLVGTQIVAKGHDFPGVHTSVVVSADRGFRIPDFRSAERTYALLVQMAGRAGRGAHPGAVYVQTWRPDHYVLAHLDDVEAYFAVELRLRATLRYPPFTRLCLIRLEGVDRGKVVEVGEALGRDLRSAARGVRGVGVLGPAAAALPRLVGRWRFQIVVRGEHTPTLRTWLADRRARIEAAATRGVRVSIDVDPRNLM